MKTATEALEERDQMIRLIQRARDIFKHCNVTTGVCCCGDDIDKHIPYNDGHSPVDEGSYAVMGWEQDVRKLFNEAEET